LSALALGCSTSNTTGDRSGAPRSNAPTSPSSTNTTTGGQSASVPPAGATGAAGTFVVGTSPPNTSTAPPTGCKNLQCQQHGCAAGATTISGRVFDPAGKNPLYNVAVYVPNEPVLALKPGASCDSCDAQYSGKAVVSTLTDATGHFTLDKAPDGENIPLVVQIGKWRKQVTIPSVARCQDTALPKELTTLPRNRMEGDLPNIAIATGGADTLECLLRRVGLDASEYTPGAGGEGHVHIFQGGSRGRRESPNTSPAAPLASAELWSSVDKLMAYDVVLLSCEGQETLNMNQQALHDYADRGGRVFASHYHYSWFNTGPYASEELAVWTPGGQDVGDINGSIVTTFPKGKALAQWLEDRHVLVNGELPIQQARHNADVDMANDVSQPWIVGAPGSPAAGATQYFSFNTPTDQARVPDGKVCGRVVFSDLHVGAASADQPERPVPTGCSNVDLSAQEMALEFMLFDLSACVIPDDVPPEPPPDLH
jgi:hypothetical protein